MSDEIEQIRIKLDKSENILNELYNIASYPSAEKEKKFLEKSANALLVQLSSVHKSLDSLIREFNINERRKVKPKINIKTDDKKSDYSKPIHTDKKSRESLMEETNITSETLKSVRRKISYKKEEESEEPIKPSVLASLLNPVFGNLSLKLAKKPLFKNIEIDLRKANIPYMLSSYISIILFFILIVFVVSVSVALALSADTITAIRNIAIAILVVFLAFLALISYPSTSATLTKRKIDAELPFAVSYMSAIASSGVKPSRIFSVMALTKEYSYVRKEINKVLNQINIYGYDLTTALRNSSKITSSKKISDLFNGMAAAITSGGDLTSYLNERARGILLDYKLERDKYTSTIGIYSDVYTALLIAAPLIFMLVLVVMSMMGTTLFNADISVISNFGIVIIALLNILFLILLHLTQPII